MALTYTFAVAADPATTPVVAQTVTRRIVIAENASVTGYPTTDFLVRRPSASSTPIQQVAGSDFVFDSPGYFGVGAIVGYVSGVSGSTTFQQHEQGF